MNAFTISRVSDSTKRAEFDKYVDESEATERLISHGAIGHSVEYGYNLLKTFLDGRSHVSVGVYIFISTRESRKHDQVHKLFSAQCRGALKSSF